MSCIAVCIGIMHMLYIRVGCFHPKLLTFIKKLKSHYTTSMTNKAVTFFCVECCYSLIPTDSTRLLVAVMTKGNNCTWWLWDGSWDCELFVLFVAECFVRDAVCVWIPSDAALQVDRRQPQSASVFSPHLLGTLFSGISWHRGEVLGLEWQRILSH